MKPPLISYKMCIPNQLNNFVITNHIVNANNPLSAAKKLYRNHKSLLHIYVLDTNTNEIHQYETKYFFTKKKDHLLKR
jgi:hypothetical protein